MVRTARSLLSGTPISGLERPVEKQADAFFLRSVCKDDFAWPRWAAAAPGASPDQVADLLVSSVTALCSLGSSLPRGESQKRLEGALSSFVTEFVEEHSKVSTREIGHNSESSPWDIIGVGLRVYNLASDMAPGDVRSLLIDAASKFVDRGMASLP